MLNLFKSKAKEVEAPKEAVSDQLVADLENAKMEIESLKKALSIYDETLSNHWATIARLQGMDSRLESPNTKKIKRLEDDNFVMNQAIAKLLEADYEKKMDKKFNDFLKKYKDGIENHAMHINSLLSSVDDMRKDVRRIKVLDNSVQSLRGYAQRHDGHIGYMTKRINNIETVIKHNPLASDLEATKQAVNSIPKASVMTKEQMEERRRIRKKEYAREYYSRQQVKKAAREYAHNWYQKNKDVILARKKAQREADKEAKNAVL